MALIFFSKDDVDRFEPWKKALKEVLPDLDVRFWKQPGNIGEIEFALVWKPPPGMLKTFPNLRAVFSVGAGVDSLLNDPELPAGIPVCRMVDESLTQGMVEYSILHVLRHHRNQTLLETNQRAAKWITFSSPLAAERRVGVMGLGAIGGPTAKAISGLGFETIGWSRNPKELTGVECMHGKEGIKDFLSGTEIVVCLLPLTPETEDILNKDLFAQLPMGASLINAGRGGQQVEGDILEALDSGQLSHVTLDVFREEPLPPSHPFWKHSKVTVTPHNAAVTQPKTAAILLADNINRLNASQPLINIVDISVGY